MRLRRFTYLDKTALSQYVTALEGGLTAESTQRSTRSGTGTAGIDAKLAQVAGERAREDEESRTLADTDEARFDRLLKAAMKDPEDLDWIDVTQPDVDYSNVGIGAMVAWECDIHVPDFIQILARSGEALKAIDMMRTLLPTAKRLGLDAQGLPGNDEMEAVSDFIGGLNANLVVVGEDEGTDWRIAAHLTDDFVHGDVEGRARIVGKVSRVLRAGQWKPYLTFPGMNLGSREDRRRMERQRPALGKENEYIAGPALMLDLLAIYR
jgi:hypothetical protein